MQAHLLGLFDNVYRVEFHDKNYDQILKVISQETEEVDLVEPVLAQVRSPAEYSWVVILYILVVWFKFIDLLMAYDRTSYFAYL